MSPDSAFSLPHSPVAVIGTITLLVAFLVNGYALVAGIAGHRRNRPGLVASSLWASWAFSALMCLASALMVYAFVSHDYTIKYVAHYSDTSMPLFYKLTAYWGGLDGSIMFWVWMLSMFSAVALFVNRKRHPEMIGYVIATIAAVATFFLAVILWNKNPFSTFLTAPPVDGKGLNPLLQTYWMAIHPPSLYTGYVGMTIPFAFCIGALASGRLDDAWLSTVRAWVMIPWFFLSFGLTLGGLWAYEELGWGGYWAWDPVENAGLIPWFTATAFLHSSVIQERRGMLRVWNVVLMVITFFLTIFGTFMTRSGVVQSVHAFGQDNELALLFILFMAVILIFSLGLIMYRLPSLRSTAAYESFWSREFAFLLNNWVLLACAFFVLFATMFPTLSESITGQRITVAAPFFNKWMTPLGLSLLLLTGIGPLLAWRTTTRKRLWEQLAFPAAVSLLTLGLVSVLLPRWRVKTAFMSDKLQLPVALICVGLIALTFGSVFQEFWRGTLARRRQTGTDALTSLVGVVLSKKRKYGGYVVHLAVALMFFGFAGKARSVDKQVTLERKGETFALGEYVFRYDDVWTHDTDGYNEVGAQVTVLKDGAAVAVLSPSERKYIKGDEDRTSEVAIDRRLDQDIYLVLNAADPETKQANFTAFLNPLVNWVWLGFGLLFIGTVICLVPEWVVEAVRPRRRTAAGRFAEAAVMIAVVVGCTLGLVSMAQAQAPPGAQGGAQAPAVHEQPPGPGQGAMHVELSKADDIDLDAVPGVARRLFGDLVCLCGGCPRETLMVCKCGFAAGERKSILDMLAGRDLSTKAAEDAAYDAVKLAYIGKFGGERILANPESKLSWLVPYLVFAGGLIVVVVVGRTWVKRGRAGNTAVAAAPANAKRAEYEDRLDDELDRLD